MIPCVDFRIYVLLCMLTSDYIVVQNLQMSFNWYYSRGFLFREVHEEWIPGGCIARTSKLAIARYPRSSESKIRVWATPPHWPTL